MHQRVPLRPLRGSAYGLGQPDAFGTGAFRGRRFRERRDRADAAEAGAGPRVKVFRTGPCARICGWMRDLTPKEGSLAERGCAEVPPTRHVQPWAVPTPTPNTPLRKEVEREAGDPEGNLTIGRCAEEALLRREAAQSKTSARAKRSGRKEPRGRHGISAREAADCRGNREPSTADRCAERVPTAGRVPENTSRPALCGASPWGGFP